MHHAIQHHARVNLTGEHSTRINPFTVRFDPRSDLRFLNYAVPDDGAVPTDDQLRSLVKAFTGRDLLPRVEFLPSCAPELEPLLAANGFEVESLTPLMVCPTGQVTPRSTPGVTITRPTAMSQYLAATRVQYRAFGETDVPGEAEAVAHLVAPVERGGTAAIAVSGSGTVVAVGAYSAPVDGVTELAGIAVDPRWRGRGIGAAISAWLTRDAHDNGVATVWLDPSGGAAQRLYERVGFVQVGEKLAMARD